MNDYTSVFTQQGVLLGVLDNAHHISYNLQHNDLWTASFSLPSEDLQSAWCQAHNLIQLPYDGRELGLFRIIGMPESDEVGMSGLKRYAIEHVMATLLDDLLFGYHEVGGDGITTANVISYILSKQTEVRWQLGSCAFADEFSYSFENTDLLSALMSLGEVIGEEFTWEFDTNTTPWTINLKKADQTPGCGIHYLRNMQAIHKSMDASGLVTRLYLLGYGEGVNQLNITGVNGGKPYLDADNIDQWGIKSSVFVDTRLEDADTLKARGEQLLERLKNPYISYTASAIDLARITGHSWDSFMPGKLVRALDSEHHIDFIARIISIAKNDMVGRPGEITITIANADKDAAGSQNAIANRVGIGELYSQGATNLYAQQYADNADSESPAIMRVYIPSNAARINTVLLSWSFENFRAYSTGAAAGGTTTSGDGGADVITSDAGGAVLTSSGSGGGVLDSTGGGGGVLTSSGAGGAVLKSSGGSGGGTKTSKDGGGSTETAESALGEFTGDANIVMEAGTGSTGAMGGTPNTFGPSSDVTGGVGAGVISGGTVAGATGGMVAAKNTGGSGTDAGGGPSPNYTDTKSAGAPGTGSQFGSEWNTSATGGLSTSNLGDHQHYYYPPADKVVIAGAHSHSITQHYHDVRAHSHEAPAGHWHDLQSHKHAMTEHNHSITDHAHSSPAEHKHSIGHTHDLSGHNHAMGAHTHGIGNHIHAMADHAHSVAGHTHSVKIPAHKHDIVMSDHNHGITIEEHQHEIELLDHMHSISLDDHQHDIDLPDHQHNITLYDHNHEIDDHTHDIVYGIYKGSSATAASIKVDGNLIPAELIEENEMDLVPYLSKNADGKINRGTWHSIEIIPNALTRIEANLFVQTFIQSRGGGDY